jgi:hypothetical protein
MPNSTKTIICLVASRKTGGRCIAGKEVSAPHSWIRPVNDGDTDAINNIQSRYADGQMTRVLDIVEIPVISSKPKLFQKENFLIDTTKKWEKKGGFNSKNLNTLLDNPSSLWNKLNSSYNGENDRILEADTKTIQQSLYFINIDCTIIVKIEGQKFNNPNKKVRCRFNYNNRRYILPVTDPANEQIYLNK